MTIRHLLSPLSLAVASLLIALPAAPALAAAAAPSATAAAAVHKFVLKTGLAGGKMVFLDARGQVNPTLQVRAGDTVEIEITSGEGAQHDMVIPELGLATPLFDGRSGVTRARFKAGQPGSYTYYCTVAGHRQIGMEGTFVVTPGAAAAVAPVAARAGAAVKPVAARPAAAPAPLAAADARAVSVVQDPRAVPASVGARPPQLVKYRIETVELVGRLADGTSFTYWTFDRKVPGPMLRVRHGDSVELTLANAADSTAVHSIDLHAVTGPGGAAEYLQVPPGHEKTVTFKALNPGLYVYHCATASVPHHISAGMYGLILVEPEGGLAPADREYYVMQGDIYTQGKTGAKGHQPFDHDKLAAEQPDYYVFNGAVGALTKENALQAKVGETVRIYFGVGGPNKVSSFHVIGEIFDKVYSEGSLSGVNKDVQTTLVPPGGATIVEFKVQHPGRYVLVDHALSRVAKGLAGFLEVTGPADPSIFVEHAH